NSKTIVSDGLGYHAWTRALIERDLRFCRPELEEVGALSRKDPGRGVCQNQFPPGLALIRFPVMAPLVDTRPGAPLVSGAEHRANLYLGAIALLATCALTVATCLRLGVPARAAHLATLALTFGTGLFHYATFDASFTHVYSALGMAMLLWLGVRHRRSDARFIPAAAGVVAFFLTAIRLTNIIALGILLVGYLLWSQRHHIRARFESRSLFRDGAPVLMGIALALAIQVAYNYYASGELMISSYGPAGRFLFERPKQLPVLFSYERGLFTWYPALAVALAAVLSVRRSRFVGIWFAALIAAYVALYGFWHNWHLGGGFGHRGFVDLAPIGMVALALALGALAPRRRALVTGAILLGAAITIQLMAGYWRGSIPFQGATQDVYWSHVLGANSWWGALHR
ncbi:MAG: hypothetical protein ACRDJF_03900, partial [Actinomycetota bacterium]